MAIAFFLTFSTYGTWLHGADKGEGSVDREHNQYGTAFIEPNPAIERFERETMTQEPFLLCERQRQIVLRAMLDLASEKAWNVLAAHVRTNHVHIIVSADRDPGRVMSDLKARASRDLSRAGFGDSSRRRWTRHGSTLHLFTVDSVNEKVHYVLHEQGAPMARYDGTTANEPRTK